MVKEMYLKSAVPPEYKTGIVAQPVLLVNTVLLKFLLTSIKRKINAVTKKNKQSSVYMWYRCDLWICSISMYKEKHKESISRPDLGDVD